MKQKVHVLLVSNETNNNSIVDDTSYESNIVDFSFLNEKYEVVLEYLTLTNYKDIIDKIHQDSLIINLCDGTDTDGRPGEEVVQYLDANKRLYTGSSPRNYQWKKSDIKKYDVSTPKYILLDKNYDLSKFTPECVSHMKYPFILKPDYNGGSTGITSKSKVDNFNELKEQLELTLKSFPSIIVEEYIIGREFTALVCQDPKDKLEPLVIEPMECVFTGKEKFKHYDLKWFDWQTIEYRVVADGQLEKRIMDFTKDLFVKMNIDGYVRFDLRMSDEGVLYVNDVNPYCGIYFPPDIYGSADLIIANSKKTNHLKFTEQLFDCARNRYL